MNDRLKGKCISDSGEAESSASAVVASVVVPARIRLLRNELSASARPSTFAKFARVGDGILIAQSGLESIDAKTIQSMGRRKKQPSMMSTTFVAIAPAETLR